MAIKRNIFNTSARGTESPRILGTKLGTPEINIVEENADTIIINWSAIPNAANYAYRLADDANFITILYDDNTNSLSVTFNASELDRPFINGTTLSLQAMSNNPLFLNSDMDIISLSFENQQPLPFGTIEYTENSGSIFLEWSDAGVNCKEYKIFQSIGDTGTYIHLVTIPQSSTREYLNIGLTNDVPVSYYIEAVPVDYRYSAVISDSIVATPQGITLPTYTPPFNLYATESGVDGSITIHWSHNVASSFKFKIDGGTETVVNQTARTLTGLTVGQSYLFEVAATDGGVNFQDSSFSVLYYTPQSQNTDFLTMEQFGGEGIYIPSDGRGGATDKVTYTPYSVDNTILDGTGLVIGDYPDGVTQVTYEGASDIFTSIIGRTDLKYCALRSHKYPPVDVNKTNPINTVGAKYANIIKVVDGKTLLFDFEVNGRNGDSPQILNNAKGYAFFDNSVPYDSMMDALNSGSVNEIKLLPLTYVIPQFREKTMAIKPIKIWTGSTNIAYLKCGWEDWAYVSKISPIGIWQSNTVFRGIYHYFTLHNVTYLPPHNNLKDAVTSLRKLFIGCSVGTKIALVSGVDGTYEHRLLDAAGEIEEEIFWTWSIGALEAGGATSSHTDIGWDSSKGYTVQERVNLRGMEHYDLNCNGEGSGFTWVTSNFNMFTGDQRYWRETSQKIKCALTDDRTGFGSEITSKNYYAKAIKFLDSSTYNLPQRDAYSSRSAILQIEGNTGDTFVFHTGMHNQFRIEIPQQNGDSPVHPSAGAIHETLDKRLMSAFIPEVGEIYRVTREYSTNLLFDDLRVFTVPDKNSLLYEGDLTFLNTGIRSHISWSTMLGKQGNLFDANDLAEIGNYKPIHLQVGDQIKIPNDPSGGTTVYTCIASQRGIYSIRKWDITNTSVQAGHTFEYKAFDTSTSAAQRGYSKDNCDSNAHAYFEFSPPVPTIDEMPDLVFEVEIVKSQAAYLNTGVEFNAYITFMSNTAWRLTSSNNKNFPAFAGALPVGHMVYNQEQVGQFHKNSITDGYYRQNNINYSGATYDINLPTCTGDTPIEARPLWAYSQGITSVNSRGFSGQWGVYRDYYYRDEIQKYLGQVIPEKDKAKSRSYNGVVDGRVCQPNLYRESYPDDRNAPDLPAPVRALLDTLPGSVLAFEPNDWTAEASDLDVITVDWTNFVEDIIDIQYSTDPDFYIYEQVNKVRNINISDASAEISGLEEGTTYYVRIWTKRTSDDRWYGDIESGPSDTKIVTTLTP